MNEIDERDEQTGHMRAELNSSPAAASSEAAAVVFTARIEQPSPI